MFGEMEHHSYRIHRENKPRTIYELVNCFLLKRLFKRTKTVIQTTNKLYTESDKRTFSITEAARDFNLAWVMHSLKKTLLIITETEIILFIGFIISTFVIDLIQLYRHSFCPLILNVGSIFVYCCAIFVILKQDIPRPYSLSY